jgi:Leucine-rich repeat (LRR) protein
MLQPCFLEDHNCLKKLQIGYSPSFRLLQLRSCTALEELTIGHCESLTVLEGDFTFLKELMLRGNSGLESLELRSCTALESLEIDDCASLATLEGNFTCLRKLDLLDNPRLKSLELHFCTALEDLRIQLCESLDTLEDFRSLTGLRYLDVSGGCPGVAPYLERLTSQGYELCAGLERLHTDDYSFLTTSFCKCLTSLQRLGLREVTELTDERERALQLLTSLQELQFINCSLAGLPVGLHSLSSLKRLDIRYCRGISMLPEKGLPPSLEQLDIFLCSEGLSDECRTLATRRSKPRVRIDEEYVN